MRGGATLPGRRRSVADCHGDRVPVAASRCAMCRRLLRVWEGSRLCPRADELARLAVGNPAAASPESHCLSTGASPVAHMGITCGEAR
jgi:hypothetical protein